MLGYERDIDPERYERFESALHTAERRLLDATTRLLDGIDSDGIAEQLDAVLFQASELLPKRSLRPGPAARGLALIVDQLASEYDLDDTQRADCMAAAAVVLEYYDVVDDLLDGDVASGREREVLATTQAAVPLLVSAVGELGPAAVDYWTDEALWLAEAPLAELSAEPSGDVYLTVLDRQSTLHGFVTGLVPVVAGRDDEVDRAERLGRAHFRVGQLLLDGEQRGDDDPWNAFALFDNDTVLERLRSARAEFERLSGAYSARFHDRVAPLLAVEIDGWYESVAAPGAGDAGGT